MIRLIYNDPHETDIFWGLDGEELAFSMAGGWWCRYIGREVFLPETPERIALWTAMLLRA